MIYIDHPCAVLMLGQCRTCTNIDLAQGEFSMFNLSAKMQFG